MLDLVNISFKDILKDINIHLDIGQTLGIIGPNGGGKTTLIALIAGLLLPTKGEVWIDESVVSLEDPYPYQKIGLLPQRFTSNGFFPLSVEHVLKMPFKILNKKNSSLKWDQSFYEQIIEKLAIGPYLERNIDSLSVGERQRCLLAMAIIKKPKILLLDEPLTGLDGLGVDQIFDLLQLSVIKKNMVIIIIDHNITQLMKSADKILCLNKSGHWHNDKNLLTKEILQNYYHCEFEHLMLHKSENFNSSEHHACSVHNAIQDDRDL